MKLITCCDGTSNPAKVFSDGEEGDFFKLTDRDGDVVVVISTDEQNWVSVATSAPDEYDLGITWNYDELMEHVEEYHCLVRKLTNPAFITDNE